MSFLLGGRYVSRGTPLPSPALVSASMKVEPSFRPGCLCAVTLENVDVQAFVEEAEEYGKLGGGYPCRPNTPFVEAQRPMVV